MHVKQLKMGVFLEWLSDVFLATGARIADVHVRDLTAHYQATLPYFSGDEVRVLRDWDEDIREALHSFKYEGARSVGEALAVSLARQSGPFLPSTIVTWVPGRPFQYILRGYNPSRILAQCFARTSHLPCQGLLVKTRASAHQAQLDRQERLKNLCGAFRVKHQTWCQGADVLLVDDVVTTGATFHEIASVLKMGGAKTVKGLFVTSTTIS